MIRIPNLATIALVVAICSVANATVIYQDNFDGAADPLDGRTPNVAPTDETWSAADNYLADGTVTGSSGDINAGAWLPVTIAAGNIYRLTATYTVPYAGGTSDQNKEWIAAGFEAGGQPIDSFTGDGLGSLLLRRNGNASIYIGSGTAGGSAYEDPTPYVADDGVITVVTTLDATDADSANWTIAWSATGNAGTVSQDAATAASGDYGDIAYLGFSHSKCDGTLGSMTFELIPEPATMGLLATGALAMLRRRRG